MFRASSNYYWRLIGLSFLLSAGINCVNAEAGQTPAQTVAICAACHRLDNKPNGIAPIVTLGKEQIIAMMRGFKARERSSSTMHVVSSTLSDAEIVALAGYLSDPSRKAGR